MIATTRLLTKLDGALERLPALREQVEELRDDLPPQQVVGYIDRIAELQWSMQVLQEQLRRRLRALTHSGCDAR